MAELGRYCRRHFIEDPLQRLAARRSELRKQKPGNRSRAVELRNLTKTMFIGRSNRKLRLNDMIQDGQSHANRCTFCFVDSLWRKIYLTRGKLMPIDRALESMTISEYGLRSIPSISFSTDLPPTTAPSEANTCTLSTRACGTQGVSRSRFA
jgi:hypothetical protein